MRTCGAKRSKAPPAHKARAIPEAGCSPLLCLDQLAWSRILSAPHLPQHFKVDELAANKVYSLLSR